MAKKTMPIIIKTAQGTHIEYVLANHPSPVSQAIAQLRAKIGNAKIISAG